MSDVNASVPHSARIWNYWLGGKDFYPADKTMGDQIMQFFPEIVENARGNRYFLCRVIRYLVEQAGITQFLDIGTGLPTADNTHEVAQSIDPTTRIVYVDNDPLVLTHAQALLTGTPDGRTAYLDADVEDPDTILREAAKTLDFDRPIALVMVGIMQFVKDLDRAYAIVRQLVDALPSGSHLVLTHPTNAVRGARMDEAVRQWNDGGGSPELTLRTVAQLEPFFAGLDLLDPGLVSTADWRPDLADDSLKVDDHGAVAAKR